MKSMKSRIVVIPGIVRQGVLATTLVVAAIACIPLFNSSTMAQSSAPDREITNLEYPSVEGRKMTAVLSMPKGKGPFPIIVTIHGGKGDRELNFIRTLAVPGEISPTVNMLNEQPWAVLAVSYRAGAIFGVEEDDIVAGIRFAKTLPGIDPNRVGVLGGSHGGMLALRAAEMMGKEIVGVAAGSPWMTNPRVYLYGDQTAPPLSQISPQALKWLLETFRKPLLQTIEIARRMSKVEIDKMLNEHSIEDNAEKIVVPVLFLTSLADVQVPHILVQPTIAKLKAAKRDVTVYTADKSLHGFYWGRNIDGGARAGMGPKTPVELEEEATARAEILKFFKRCFDGKKR